MSKISITKAGQSVLADKMTSALHVALNEGAVTTGQLMLSLIVLLIGGSYMDRDLMDKITGKDGGGGFHRLEQVEIEDIAIALLERKAAVIAPAKPTSATVNEETYRKGEVIGTIVGADHFVRSFGTLDVLHHLSRSTLLNLATEVWGMPEETVLYRKAADLRRHMAAQQVMWCPISFATFTEDLS
ncbi:hypothetical protein [Gluconobacter cerinus]|uniref:hypothetical protein n=1 Tax=Gluconobacter cerinus TaxID=38307 RepID=UPI001C046A86|nr:hypothetical protein [Gluconobacter cerinus]